LVYKKYIYKKGKKFGPYYFKSIRDSSGSVKSIYLGKRHPNYNLFILLGVIGFVLLSLIGFVSYNAFVVSDEVISEKGVEEIPEKEIILEIEESVDEDQTEVEIIEELIDDGIIDIEEESISIEKEIIVEEIFNETEVEPNENEIIINETEIEGNDIVINASENITEEALINNSEIFEEERQIQVNNSVVVNLTEDNKTHIEINDTVEILNVSEINQSFVNVSKENYTLEITENIFPVKINEPVKVKKIIISDKEVSGINISLPIGAVNVSIFEISGEEEIKIELNGRKEKKSSGNLITGNVALGFEGFSILEFLQNIFRFTGLVVYEESNNIIITDNVKEIRIEYYLPGPVSVERDLGNGIKEIIISSDINYSNVTVYSNLGNVNGGITIKDSSGKIIDYVGDDLDNDGLIDYVEWVSPTSEEIYTISITILNIQSYPVVGGNWTVKFNTTGTADLKIRPVNGTTWDIVDGDFDLKFLDIRCGEGILDYVFENQTILINNYSCSETGYENSYVITSGKHYLEFDFGGIKANAQNDALACGTSLTSNTDYLLTADVICTSNSHGLLFSSDSNIVLDCDGHTIDGNNKFEDYYGIYLYNSNNITVKNCIITDFDNGVHTLWGPGQNNTLFNNTISDNAEYGIFVSSASWTNNNISNNTIHSSNINSGLILYAPGNVVSGNKIYNNSQRGIIMSSYNGNVVDGNTIYDNTLAGIYIASENNNISNNIIYNNSDYGIRLNGASNTTIYSNEIYENQDQNIYLQIGSSDNLIKNNMIHNSDTDQGIRIVNTDSMNNHIINNTIYENNNGGIWAGSWGSHVGPGNIISNNTIANHTNNRAIFVEMNNSVISGNIIYNSKNAGIYVYYDSYNMSIYDNIVYDNPHVGIYVVRIYDSNISNNFVYNNVQQGLYVRETNNSIFEKNNLTGNWISASYGGANQFVDSYYNTFTENRFIGSGDFLIRAYTNFNNNTFINNVFANSTDELFRCGDGSSCNYNVFIGNTFETNISKPGLRFATAEGNVVIDSVHFGPGANPEHSGADNNTIYINTTWTNPGFVSANVFTRKWYLDVKVNTSDGDLENANVSVYNNTNILEFSELSGASGLIVRKNFTEYVYDGSTYTYYSNYTINTTSPSASYSNDTREFNLTDNVFAYITLGGLNDAPNNPVSLLTSIDGLNLTSSDLNCSATISDPNSDLLNVSVRWYKNDVLNLTTDYNNSYSSGILFNATLGSENTTTGEIWNCSIKLNDGEFDSDWGVSNGLSIIDTVSPVIAWENPTPVTGTRINVSSVYLNASMIDGAYVSSFFDWNNSLVGYWNFESYNDSGIFDNSSHDNFLSFYGSLSSSSLVDSTYGSGMYFDGVNDKLQLDWGSSFDKPVDGLTISFWLNQSVMPDWNYDFLVGRAYSISWVNPYFEYGIVSKNVIGNTTHFKLFSRIDGTAHGDSDPVQYNVWHHISLVWDGSSQDLTYYVDGVAAGTDNQGISSITYQLNGPLVVGLNLDNGEDFEGSLDEILVFSRALGVEEIGEIYQNSDYLLERNFTSLSGGNYSFIAHSIDTSGNYNVSSEREIIINGAPVVESSRVSPVSPYTVDTLLGYCNASDVNSDNVTYSYEWYKDGILNNGGDSYLCASGHTDNGDGTCTVTLRPDSAGDLTEFPSPSPVVSNYLNVDESSTDEDSTFVGSTGDSVGTPTTRIAIKENSVVSYDTTFGIGGTYSTDTWTKSNRPSDSSFWTISDIDSLQVGVNTTTTLGTSDTDLYNLPVSNIPAGSTINNVKTYVRARTNVRTSTNIRVTQVYAEVKYTPTLTYYLPNVEVNVNNLSNSLTTKWENWTFNCMAFDGVANASAWLNDSVIIQNSLPAQVSLSSPEDGNNTQDRTPTLTWSVPSDDDSDSLTYHVFVNDSAGGIIYNQTGIATNSYTFSSDLTLDDTYFWRIRANDSEDFGTWSDLWNFTVDSVVTISATTGSISFGSLGPGVTDNTSDDSPSPFVIQNDGNSLINISVNASQLFDQAAMGTDPYQFKIDNSTETGSFNWLTSIINWINMPSAAVVAIDSLKYEDSTDSAEIDILATVPTDELAGSKSSTVYFEAAIAE
jgi:parallel beta-helix repeat protein